MAFVFKSEKQLGEYRNATSEIVGPGSYIGPQEYKSDARNHPGGFNSNVPRNIPDRKEKQQLPGPGAYYINKQSGNEQVVVSSANEDIKIVEVPKPLSIFKSGTTRFTSKPSDVPGPGSYALPELIKDSSMYSAQKIAKQKQNIIDHLMQINRYQSIPSIPSNVHAYGYTESENNDLELNKNPHNIHSGVGPDIVGPGQYDQQTAFDPQKGQGAIWAKLTSKKLEQPQSLSTVVGPGTYDAQGNLIPLYKLKPSAGFISKTLRSMDQRKGMIVNEVIKARNTKSVDNRHRDLIEQEDSEQDEFMDDATPGPGAYYNASTMSSIKVQSVHRDLQYFGRSSNRFQDDMVKSYNVGPGDYNPNYKINEVKGRIPPFLSSNTRFQMKTNQESKPGPGQYDPQNTFNEKIIATLQQGRIGKFGTTQERFKNIKGVEELPGPGAYKIDKDQKVQEGGQPLSVFKSKQPRQLYNKINDIIPPVGAYQIDHFNIQKQIQVQQEQDPELRIERPGFLSQQERFKSPQQQDNYDQDDDDLAPLVQDRPAQILPKKPKDIGFQSKVQRFNYKNKADNPGPGSYYDPNNNPWDKRTYNINFAKI